MVDLPWGLIGAAIGAPLGVWAVSKAPPHWIAFAQAPITWRRLFGQQLPTEHPPE